MINKTDEVEETEYYDGLVTYIVNKWKEEGYFTECDDEEARNIVDAMLFLISSFNLKCLINSLFELYDFVDEFEDLNKKEEELPLGYS